MGLPLAGPWTGNRAERVRFSIFAAFLFLCLIGGGSARAEVMSLLYLRPAAILCVAALALTPGRWDFRPFRTLFILLGAFAATILVQLVPLPPEWWMRLPGHAPYAEAAAAAGFPQPWRPISLTPDLTINSLLALLTPLVILIGLAAIRPDQRLALVPIVIGAALASAILGILQILSSADSPFYLYAVHHGSVPAGFFANRNHQAAFLALTMPILSVWSCMPSKNRNAQLVRNWGAFLIGMLLMTTILATGSRTGAVLGVIGIIGAFALRFQAWRGDGTGSWRDRLLRNAVWGVPVVMVLIALVAGRALSIDRLIALDPQAELRISTMPVLLRMTRIFFPVGSGFGSFDPVYRGYEPDALLSPLYFNHAHNDLIELVLTGGLLATLVLAAFLAWWALKTFAALFRIRNRSARTLAARAGSLGVFILFAASLADYPLRTPLLAAIFAICCGWLADSVERARPRNADAASE